MQGPHVILFALIKSNEPFGKTASEENSAVQL